MSGNKYYVTEFRKRFILEKILFESKQELQRFTQDSPIYPEVWSKFFFKTEEDDDKGLTIKTKREDLLLNVNRDFESFRFIKYLRSKKSRFNLPLSKWRIANSGNTISVNVTFEELITVILPMTEWYQDHIVNKETRDEKSKEWLRRVIKAIYASWEVDPVSRDDAEYRFKFESNFTKTRVPAFRRAKEEGYIWSVSCNRDARPAVNSSVASIKGDATRRLFDVDGSKIRWAVIDSGVDAQHEGFFNYKRNLKHYEPNEENKYSFGNPAHSRIVETYDFTKFRDLFEILEESIEDATVNIFGNKFNRQELVRRIFKNSMTSTRKRISSRQMRDAVRDLKNALLDGKAIDWSVIQPFLTVPHDKDYDPPKHKHGTHVAGIIAADTSYEQCNLKKSKVVGVCPGIEIIDIRTLKDDGTGDEFSILAAMQFIRWLNRQKDSLYIHGVNLSLSLNHDVSNYACGRTPICEECDRLIAEGAVVVAAAGNSGQAFYFSENNQKTEGFRTISITDPGNAENVITVGSTHRTKPHTYGVSYFSSRGPTGDGRIKPDLVAPGEKIKSTVPKNGMERMDGTSMAAPHVSGAAALLLAKNRELIGYPRKVKEILCQGATDLGRERYFQGCGMLDILRAMQTI